MRQVQPNAALPVLKPKNVCRWLRKHGFKERQGRNHIIFLRESERVTITRSASHLRDSAIRNLRVSLERLGYSRTALYEMR